MAKYETTQTIYHKGQKVKNISLLPPHILENLLNLGIIKKVEENDKPKVKAKTKTKTKKQAS